MQARYSGVYSGSVKAFVLACFVLGFFCLQVSARTITINAEMSDWINSDLFYPDGEIGEGLPLNSTYSNIYVANDAVYAYFGLELKAPSSIFSNWTHNLYVDTDQDVDTGFRGTASWMSHGYDYLVQYGGAGAVYSIYAFTGTVQDAWAWQFLNLIDYAYNGAVIEWAIDRGDMNITNNQSVVLEFQVTGGDVTNVGGVETWAHSAEVSASTYTFTATPGSITLDGSLSDWGESPLFYVDYEIGEGVPENSSYSNIYVTDNAANMYIGFKTKGAGGSPITNTYLRHVFVDIDMNADTGYDGGWMAGGYDRLIEYGGLGQVYRVYDFGGASQSSWLWTNYTDLAYSYSANVIELEIPRSRLGPGDMVRLEFNVSGSGVTTETWAHQTEASVKTYYFSSEGYIPTLTEWGMILLAMALFFCALHAIKKEKAFSRA